MPGQGGAIFPGVFPKGNDVLPLTLAGGALELEPLEDLAEEHPLAARVVKCLESLAKPLPKAMPVSRAMVCLRKAGISLEWFLKQLVLIVSLALDSFLPEAGISSDPLAAGVRQQKRKRRDIALAEAVVLHGKGDAPRVC